MPYLKITNQLENHRGFQYHNGLNVLIEDFSFKGQCCAGGLYFSNHKYIFNFTDYGTKIRQLYLPVGDPEFSVVKDIDKYRSNLLIFGNVYEYHDINTWKYFTECNTDFKIDIKIFRLLYANNYFDTVKYLITSDCITSGQYNYIIQKGQLEFVELVVESCKDFRLDITSIRTAAANNRLDILKYLMEERRKLLPDTNLNYLLCSSDKDIIVESGYLDVVKYLVQNGVNFDNTAHLSIPFNHLELLKYLIESGADTKINIK